MAKGQKVNADQKNSKFILQADIKLWGGTIKALIDTGNKYYELKTPEGEGIKVSMVKIGDFNCETSIPESFSALKKLEAEFAIKYKSETEENTSKDNFTMLYLGIKQNEDDTDYKEAKDQLKKDMSFLGDDFVINSINIGYASWGDKANKDNIDFDKVHESTILKIKEPAGETSPSQQS